MILVLTAISACEDNRASLVLPERRINRKANYSQVQQMLQPRPASRSFTPQRGVACEGVACEGVACEGVAYEKNASFSAWLMRRIGASGSFAARTGLRTTPLAMRVEPSDTSIAGAGAGGAAGGGGG